MTTPISFTVRPPASSSAPHRPSPLGGSGRNGHGQGSSRAGPPSRRLFEQGGSDDEDEGHGRGYGRRDTPRDESIEGFRNGKAHGGERPAAPLVIPALPNRDWRESSRRTPSFRPEARQDQGDIDSTPDRIGDGAQHSGLRFAVKTETKQEEETKDGIQVKLETTETSATVVNGSGSASASTTVVKKEPLTLEEQALQAILAGDQERESEEERARRELVIQMQENRSMGTPMSEEAALRRDMASLPEESTMEDFEAVPISAFGIAALRGMGWDPKSADNVKAREVHRRPQLLGLGATPLDTTIKPTHKGNDKSKPKDKKKSHAERTGRGFSAASLLVRRDRDSGSVTPAEGSSRRTSPGTTGTDSDASRVRRREDDEASYDSGREGKRREGDGYRERDRERDRERERDRYGDWERDRYRERETEEERARRKAKEREREKERYPNGDRDRSRYDERDRDRDRERQREREGGRDRDRDGRTERDRTRDRDDDRDRRRDRRD